MFQSTLPHGERHEAERRAPKDKGFNPRSRTGSDADDGETVTWTLSVSIHAPARGATGPFWSTASDVWSFQPTLPHGERLGIQLMEAQAEGFNPRSRTGSDGKTPAGCHRLKKFQSTLPHGERRHCLTQGRHRFDVSIHAPARGATD